MEVYISRTLGVWATTADAYCSAMTRTLEQSIDRIACYVSRPATSRQRGAYDSNGNEAQREAALKALAERIDALVKGKSVVQLQWPA